MKLTLIHPPLDDPTIPYHSLAYLAGHMAHQGFMDFSIRDVNVEFVNYCLEPDIIRTFYAEGAARQKRLEQKVYLNHAEQEEYCALWACSRIDEDEIIQSAAGLKNRDRFLDYDAYLKNVRIVLRYFGYLGGLTYPAEIAHFRQMSRARYSIYHLNDLFSRELAETTCGLFGRYFEERLAADEDFKTTDCFGISIVYDHQLSHSVYLARALRQRFPDKRILLGGTSIAQLYKYMKDKRQMRRFFEFCDAIIVGEGETAICEIAARGPDFLSKPGIPNTITYDAGLDQLRFPTVIHYEDLNALGAPIYDYKWDMYLSPDRGINYAPTRGCYWNRCTFCDYGLNTDKPTSPWRERRVSKVIEDLQGSVDSQGIKYVYFAVDVMAPGYLERLSDAILESGLDIRWAAEVRMEKIFSAERCAKLAKSGCVCISFGMESGNQRILDLIDKGTKVDYMAVTMKNFAEAGVAVQLMAFTDFPTEAPSEKKETFEFVELNKEYWSTGGMGSFLLTGTAIIAKEPEKFGITILETQKADVARAIQYSVEEELDREVLLTEDSDASFDEDRGVFPRVLGRPWASGTDSLHTMIYYDAYGKTFFKDHPLDDYDPPNYDMTDDELLDCTLLIPGKLNESPFDIGKILKNREAFVRHIKDLLKVPEEPTYDTFQAWQHEVTPVENNGDKPQYWLTSGNKCARLEKLVYRIVTVATQQSITVRDILNALNDEMKVKMLEYFKGLKKNGLLLFESPARATRAEEPATAAASEAAACPAPALEVPRSSAQMPGAD